MNRTIEQLAIDLHAIGHQLKIEVITTVSGINTPRALAEHRVTFESGLDDHRRARLQREVAFRRGAEIDRLRAARLDLVAADGRDACDIRRSTFAKAFCEQLGG